MTTEELLTLSVMELDECISLLQKSNSDTVKRIIRKLKEVDEYPLDIDLGVYLVEFSNLTTRFFSSYAVYLDCRNEASLKFKQIEDSYYHIIEKQSYITTIDDRPTRMLILKILFICNCIILANMKTNLKYINMQRIKQFKLLCKNIIFYYLKEELIISDKNAVDKILQCYEKEVNNFISTYFNL